MTGDAGGGYKGELNRWQDRGGAIIGAMRLVYVMSKDKSPSHRRLLGIIIHYSVIHYSLFTYHNWCYQLWMRPLSFSSTLSLSVSVSRSAWLCLSFFHFRYFFLSFILFLSSSLIIISCVSPLRRELSIEIARKTVQIEPQTPSETGATIWVKWWMRNAVVATVESRLATPCNVRTNVNNVHLYIVASIPKITNKTIQFSLRLDNLLDWDRSVRSEHPSGTVLIVWLKINYKRFILTLFRLINCWIICLYVLNYYANFCSVLLGTVRLKEVLSYYFIHLNLLLILLYFCSVY